MSKFKVGDKVIQNHYVMEDENPIAIVTHVDEEFIHHKHIGKNYAYSEHEKNFTLCASV